MGDERWDAGEDFVLGCADFKMPLKNTGGELSLIRQLFVGSTDLGAVCSYQLIPWKWDEITQGEKMHGREVFINFSSSYH